VTRRPTFRVPLPDGRHLELGTRTLVMGVLNVTPDSFSAGGRAPDTDAAVAHAMTLVEEGADLLDVGGESTRPGAEPVDAATELSRVRPVLEALRGRISIPISIDTYKADVADAALDTGAAIVNDISALGYDPALTGVLARRRPAVILMHTRGRSRDMYREATYEDVVREVIGELGERVRTAEEAGIARQRIIVDPGFGFAKRAEHSAALLARLPDLHALGRPLLVGPSRKGFVQRAIGERPPDGREWATAAAVTAAVLAGAHIVRVHSVAAMRDVVRVADMLRADAGCDPAWPSGGPR
jgi:dihydropteroate synthase